MKSRLKKNNKTTITTLCILLLVLTNLVNAQVRSIKMEDGKRKYLVYLPQGYQQNPNKNFPVVFNFHGGGMTAVEQMFYSQMNKTAEKYGFIVVYPSGKNNDWNVGFETSYQYGTDDIKFVKTILDSLVKGYRIDKKAIYATGLSRGGFFTQRIAAELAGSFAGVASVSGPLPDSVKYFHQSKGKVSVMMIQGTDDKIVNHEGKTGAYASAISTFEYWATHNELNLAKSNFTHFDKDPADQTKIEIIELSKDGISVSHVNIIGGGHTWPGSNPFNIGLPLGKTSQEIDINEVIWKFFNQNSKK